MEPNAWAFTDSTLKLMGVPKKYIQPFGAKAIDNEFDVLRAKFLGIIGLILWEARRRKVKLEPLFIATIEEGEELPNNLNWLKDYDLLETLKNIDTWLNNKYS